MVWRLQKMENSWKFNTVPELLLPVCIPCVLNCKFFCRHTNSRKFRKIQENSGKFNTVPKPPAGPVCIPSVVNCNFFLQAIIAKSYVSLVVVAVWLRVTYTYHILVHIYVYLPRVYTVYTRVYTTPIFMREQARNTGRHLPKVCICTTRGFPVSAVLTIALSNVNILI